MSQQILIAFAIAAAVFGMMEINKTIANDPREVARCNAAGERIVKDFEKSQSLQVTEAMTPDRDAKILAFQSSQADAMRDWERHRCNDRPKSVGRYGPLIRQTI